jgi:DNA modification methylase
MRRLDELKPLPGNPHIHNRKQRRALASVMRKYGFLGVLIIDHQDQIVDGTLMAEVAGELGYDEVPTVRLETLSEAEIKFFRIANNKIAKLAEFDSKRLAEEFTFLTQELPIEFDLSMSGFEMPEIDKLLSDFQSGVFDQDAKEIALATAKPSGSVISQQGDLWLLNRHRVLCGDSREPSVFEALMAGASATMVLTDFPYNVKIEGNVSGLGATQHSEFAMASGEMTGPAFTEFLHTVMVLMVRHSRNGSLHYGFMDWRHMREILVAGDGVYSDLVNLCAWVKRNGGMGSLYRSRHELVFVFKNGTDPHINNVQLGKHGRNRTNVWEYDGMNSFGRAGEEGNLLELHPTVKPVRLLADAILDASRKGDIVLDPFLGSGSTLMAAQRVQRMCYGIEYEPAYVDVVIRRWQAITGDAALHAATGMTFNQLAAKEPS